MDSNNKGNMVHRLKQKMKNGRLVSDEGDVPNNINSDKSEIFNEARFKQKNRYGETPCTKSNSKIPSCFDWRDKDGVNYDTPIKR